MHNVRSLSLWQSLTSSMEVKMDLFVPDLLDQGQESLGVVISIFACGGDGTWWSPCDTDSLSAAAAAAAAAAACYSDPFPSQRQHGHSARLAKGGGVSGGCSPRETSTCVLGQILSCSAHRLLLAMNCRK